MAKMDPALVHGGREGSREEVEREAMESLGGLCRVKVGGGERENMNSH